MRVLEFLMGLAPHYLIVLGAGTGVVLGLLYFHHATVKAEDNRIAIRTEKHLNKIKGVQDEILNNAADGHAVAVGMRRGVF